MIPLDKWYLKVQSFLIWPTKLWYSGFCCDLIPSILPFSPSGQSHTLTHGYWFQIFMKNIFITYKERLDHLESWTNLQMVFGSTSSFIEQLSPESCAGIHWVLSVVVAQPTAFTDLRNLSMAFGARMDSTSVSLTSGFLTNKKDCDFLCKDKMNTFLKLYSLCEHFCEKECSCPWWTWLSDMSLLVFNWE